MALCFFHGKGGAGKTVLDKLFKAQEDWTYTVDMNNYKKVLVIFTVTDSGSTNEYMRVNGDSTGIWGDENYLGSSMMTMVRNGTNVDVYFVDDTTLVETLWKTFVNPADMLMEVHSGGDRYMVFFEVE